MSNMDNICEKLKVSSYRLKKGCIEKEDIRELAKNIKKIVHTIKPPKECDIVPFQKRNINDKKNKEYWGNRHHVTYTFAGEDETKLKETLKIDSNEIFIERLIAYKKFADNNEKNYPEFWNQFQVGKSPKEDVDIRICKNNKIKYVELKVLNNSDDADSPFFAIVESIKNYYLTPLCKNIDELIILAPVSYWEKYTNKLPLIKSLIKELETLPMKISLKKINFTNADLCEIDDIFKEYINENMNIVNGKFESSKFKIEDFRRNKKCKNQEQAKQYDYSVKKINLQDIFREKNLYNNPSILKLLNWENI